MPDGVRRAARRAAPRRRGGADAGKAYEAQLEALRLKHEADKRKRSRSGRHPGRDFVELEQASQKVEALEQALADAKRAGGVRSTRPSAIVRRRDSQGGEREADGGAGVKRRRRRSKYALRAAAERERWSGARATRRAPRWWRCGASATTTPYNGLRLATPTRAGRRSPRLCPRATPLKSSRPTTRTPVLKLADAMKARDEGPGGGGLREDDRREASADLAAASEQREALSQQCEADRAALHEAMQARDQAVSDVKSILEEFEGLRRGGGRGGRARRPEERRRRGAPDVRSLAGERDVGDAADAQRLRTLRIRRGPARLDAKTRGRETAECHARARTREDGDGVADHVGRSRAARPEGRPPGRHRRGKVRARAGHSAQGRFSTEKSQG